MLRAAARTLALHAEKTRSPFSENVRDEVGSALTVIAAHHHRHLWQAGNAL
jgi:hypothetical protein